MKKYSAQKLINFLDRKGFYVILILCIAVVGVTAYIITSGNKTSGIEYERDDIITEELGEGFYNEDNELQSIEDNFENSYETSEKSNEICEDVIPEEEVFINEDDGLIDTALIAENTLEKENSTIISSLSTQEVADISSKMESSKPADEKNVLPEDKMQSFIMPVYGEITHDFAMDRLLYSKTLEEWRTHSGIDIASPRGTPVKAVADGIVSEIKHDPRYGIIVIIDHEQNIRSLYANFAGDDMVVPNQKIKQGDIIGSVGNTAVFESAEPVHLHFEVLKNNIPVDPKNYLPINK